MLVVQFNVPVSSLWALPMPIAMNVSLSRGAIWPGRVVAHGGAPLREAAALL